MDLLIDELGDFVSIVEIKGTDWDRVLPHNRKKLMAAHKRQVWRYIEKYVDIDETSVCAGIIYPRAPECFGLREEVEGYLNDYGLQVVWYDS